MRLHLLILGLLAALGCACSAPAPAPAPDATAVDLAQVDLPATDAPPATPDRGAADARVADAPGLDGPVADALQPDAPQKVWPVPPSAYDCTSVAAGPPKRVNKVPLSCVIDPKCSTLLVTGHRGVGVDSQQVLGLYVPVGRFAPENTLSAVRAAIVMGADFVELDVQLTKDNHLVLMHDDDVERTTLGKGKVSQLTLAQLQALKLKTAQFKGSFACEKVPTLAQALALAKGRINIDADLKTDATDKVALAVKAAGMIDQVFLSASSTTKLSKARTAVANIRLQVRTDKAAEIPTLLAMFKPPPSIVEIEEKILTAPNVATIHAGGARAFVNGFLYDAQGYLTNDPKVYQPLVNKKPDVIQLDRIDLLLQLLGR
jgi:glycerophosphoryl diester phosphodiesterase